MRIRSYCWKGNLSREGNSLLILKIWICFANITLNDFIRGRVLPEEGWKITGLLGNSTLLRIFFPDFWRGNIPTAPRSTGLVHSSYMRLCSVFLLTVDNDSFDVRLEVIIIQKMSMKRDSYGTSNISPIVLQMATQNIAYECYGVPTTATRRTQNVFECTAFFVVNA